MKNDYTATEERIRELVPRLKELSFGCIVELNTGTTLVCLKTYGDSFDAFYLKEGERRCPSKNQIRKIIGHPIDLEDVLEAGLAAGVEIDVFYRDYKRGEGFYICTEESFCDHGVEVIWITGKDFSQQSEECKMFIKDLLK